MNLPAPLVPILILLAAAIPAGMFLILCCRRVADDGVELGFAAVSLGILALGWPAFLLAEIGAFSATAIGLVWATITGILVVITAFSHRRGLIPRGSWRIKVNRWEILALASWAALASWLYFRPHEFVIGGADAGVYVDLGANIAQTGSILIRDPALADIDPEQYPVWLRAMPPGEAAPYYLLPGFYVPGTPRGEVVPQFYHLHPVWQAIGFALGGLWAELLVTPLWGLLGCLAAYMTVRTLWGWRVGLLALTALTFTALQVWFSRYPTAEMLTQYLIWTGVWALIMWITQRAPRGLWAALAGLSLGQVFLTRVDVFPLLVLPVLLAAWLAWTRSWHRDDGWFFVLFSFLVIHSLFHALWISGSYSLTQFRFGLAVLSGSKLLSVYTVAPLIVLLAALILAGALRRQSFGRWWSCMAHYRGTVRTVLLCTGAVAVLIAALYAYFIRPQLGRVALSQDWYGGGQIPNLDHENLVRLGWYLSPGGLALSVAGVCVMLVKEANRRTAALLGIGLLFSAVFIWRMGANPHQIYAMRRYVPEVLPFAIISAAFLVQWVYRSLGKLGKWVSIGLTVVWLGGILLAARGFVSQVDYRGIVAQLDRLNANLKPGSVLIFNDPASVGVGDFLGTPLHFLYHHDVFTLRDPQSLSGSAFEERVRRWQSQGRTVYWASVAGGFPLPSTGLDLVEPMDYRFTALVLENVYDRKPAGLFEVAWTPFTVSAFRFPD